jgi:hypothetical protein
MPLQTGPAGAIIVVMKLVNSGVSLSLFLFLVIFTSCGGPALNSNSQNSSVANGAVDNSSASKSNVEELGMLVNVPYESEESVWKEDRTQKKLVAVLRFRPAEADRLIADAVKIKPPENVTIEPQSWFPPELVAQSETSGDDNLNGKAYAANAFFEDPYNDGRITRVEDSDYFVLEVYAK